MSSEKIDPEVLKKKLLDLKARAIALRASPLHTYPSAYRNPQPKKDWRVDYWREELTLPKTPNGTMTKLTTIADRINTWRAWAEEADLHSKTYGDRFRKLASDMMQRVRNLRPSLDVPEGEKP